VVSVFQLLKKYQIRPKKGLGQNFLADANHLAKIIEAADLAADDIVLEIGPGLGALSVPLAERAGAVVAVEVDSAMVEVLRQEMISSPNFQVVEANILTVDPAQLLADHWPDFTPDTPYFVIANLPYYITSAIIQHLLEAPHPPRRLVITVQKEVAQRIVARPGEMSILAVSVQFYGQARLCHTIPATAFVPPPKVASAVIRIDLYDRPQIDVARSADFFRVVKAGFGQKRKQLKNSLAAGLHRSQAEVADQMVSVGINPTRRAQTLSLEEWATLTRVLTASAQSDSGASP
jgi:16S rRNA (adenine1518-N6/adenine1519-N6)-dimethyltransferase